MRIQESVIRGITSRCAGAPVAEEDREVRAIGGAVAVQVATRAVPGAEQDRQVGTIDGEVTVQVAGTVAPTTGVRSTVPADELATSVEAVRFGERAAAVGEAACAGLGGA